MLPTGVVTFLFTDVVGSTRLWELEPQAMAAAMIRHDELVEAAVAEAGGELVRPRGEGDSRFAVFTSPRPALLAAAGIGRTLATQDWPTSTPIQVRTAVHTGEAELRAGDYYGDAVNRCARLRSLAHPGQILLTAAARARVPDLASGLSIRDLGEHRLKDLSRPESIAQLVADGLDDDFPPLASLARVRHNLPVQLTSFRGRGEDLAAVATLIAAHRLVTIVGFGGVGKTRLALQVAARLAAGSSMPTPLAQAWFVDLSAETDPSVVPTRVAETLGVAVAGREPLDALVAAFRDAPGLLVLDNLEQILDCASFVHELLAATEDVTVLATSREPLRVLGEQQYPLRPLVVGAAPTGGRLPGSPAIDLFLDRARAVKPGFVIDDRTASDVHAICSRLDGAPLAIELAAAHSKTLRPAALRSRLEAGLHTLGGGMRDMPERQRSLRATIAWSVDTLKPQERELLTALAILPASADLELISSLLPDAGVEQLLEELVDKSLVTVEEGADVNRYGLLVSVRDYMLDGADPAALHDYRERHAGFMEQRLNAAFWDGSVLAQDAVVRDDPAHLRAAIAHRVTHGPAAAEVQLVCDLGLSWVEFGHAQEYLDFSAHALLSATDPRDRALLHFGRHDAFKSLGRGTDADREAEEAITEARRSSDPWIQLFRVVTELACASTEAEVWARHEEMQALAAADSDVPESERRSAVDDCDLLLSRALRIVNPAEAEKAARRLIGPYADPTGRCLLTPLLLDRGDIAKALEVTADIEAPGRDLPTDEAIGVVLTRAEVLLAAGRLPEALDRAERAFEAHWISGHRSDEEGIVLCDVQVAAGDLAGALSTLERALTRLADAAPYAIAKLQWRRAVLLRRLGGERASSADLLQAISALPLETFRRGLPDLLGALTELASRVIGSDPDRAATLLGYVDETGRTVRIPMGMGVRTAEVEQLVQSHRTSYDAGRHMDEAEAVTLASSL